MKTKTLITLLISNVTKKRASEGQLLLKLVFSLCFYFMSQSSPSPRFFIQQLFVTLYIVCVRAIVYSSNCTYPGTYVNYLYTCTFDIIILKFTYSYLSYIYCKMLPCQITCTKLVVKLVFFFFFCALHQFCVYGHL